MHLSWYTLLRNDNHHRRIFRHRLLVGVCIIVLTSILVLPGTSPAGHFFFPQVRDRIKQQVEAEIHQQGYTCSGEILCGLQAIPIFYQGRSYAPMWFGVDGLLPTGKALVDILRQSRREGLNPWDYHLQTINQLIGELSSEQFPPDSSRAKQWADLDLMLTDAYLLLGAHLSGGRINPENLHADWLLGPRSMEMADVLSATETVEQMTGTLNRLKPKHQGYTALTSALEQLRQIAARGGWTRLDVSHTLRPDETDEAIAVVRQRLAASGDYQAHWIAEPSTLYDETLVAAVKRFQQRHGLEPDGVIGPKTRDAMNVTVQKRIQQIELNLERWRWLPADLGERYIIVNTAAFYLHVVEDQIKKLEMKVVVGRPARQSPVFSAAMTYMVLNPYWNVPHKLAVEDILPKAKKGVDYLLQQKFKVFTGWGKDAQEIDPLTIDWVNYSKHRFPFRLRQEPGAKNALGQIKFMFPNKFAVYLHDTPQKSLFSRFQRDFSSGCIRVEDARTLARYLLSDDPTWTSEKLDRSLAEKNRKVVHVPRPIAIHLQYMTAWVDQDGTRQFRQDIYRHDHELSQALINRDPYPLPPLTVIGQS